MCHSCHDHEWPWCVVYISDMRVLSALTIEGSWGSGAPELYIVVVLALKSKAIAHQWLLSCVGESMGFSGNMRRSSVFSGILRMADVCSRLVT